MPIPDYQSIMKPLLNQLSDGKEYTRLELTKILADHFNLSKDERRVLKPSGGEPLFRNRVGWANFYLKKAGLTESKKRGLINITEEGLKALGTEKIDRQFLMNYEKFQEFMEGTITVYPPPPQPPKTPEEEMDYNYQKIRQELSDGLLELIKSNSAWFFEKLVIDLLQAMGYGGFPESGEGTPKSRDGGIDGIIKQDKLGIDKIYIQAKKYTDKQVSRDEIQKFVGAIQGKGQKGVFITTSIFSKPAIEFSNITPSNIVLIDGENLTKLMIDHGIGVSETKTYKIKKIDSDYFIEE